MPSQTEWNLNTIKDDPHERINLRVDYLNTTSNELGWFIITIDKEQSKLTREPISETEALTLIKENIEKRLKILSNTP